MTKAPLTYGSYLKVPELLSLQKELSAPPEHDETLFIVIHQVYELWFKLMLHEIDEAKRLVARDRLAKATRLLRRVGQIQRILVEQIHVLETMRPYDFLAFRYNLNPASGFQSLQFREVEIVLGMGDPAVLQHMSCSTEERERIEGRFREPTIPDVYDALLERRGFSRRDAEWRVAAVTAIYGEPGRHADLVALSEALIDLDEWLSLWRFHHLQMVERMIGEKPGTGGSEGVAYLAKTIGKRAFPDLWKARTGLGQEV
jgi:tryptophan 2,3-dioxygenase